MNNIKNKDGERQNSKTKRFMSGVILLSFSTLAVKIIGLVFKIPMLSFLGTEGMGYFNSAYEIYALLCIISTAGLPVALSMLVSQAYARESAQDINRIYKSARALFLALGILGALAMLLLYDDIAIAIGNPDSKFCILAIAPALFFICMASLIRGYCQGFENMAPTAISQFIEAISKLGFGLAFAIFAISRGMGVPEISAMSILGVTLGTLLSMIYLLFAKMRMRKSIRLMPRVIEKKEVRKNFFLRKLISIAFPITLGSAVLGLTRIIDMTLIMRRLQDIGISIGESNSIYGAYTTLAVPVFSLVPSLIAPISMALVPQLAAFVEKKNISGQSTVVENSMRLTVLLALPASLGLVAFARPMLDVIFAGQTYAVEIAAPLLSVLGASVLFSCLITTTNAILQSYGKTTLPIISMFIGVAVKFAVSYVLIGNEFFGVMGAPIGSLACNITVTAINIVFMCNNKDVIIDIKKIFFKPAWISLLSVGVAFAVYIFMFETLKSSLSALVLAIVVAVLIYFVFSRIAGSITDDDILSLPFGEKLMGRRDKDKKTKEKRKNDGESNCCTKKKGAS